MRSETSCAALRFCVGFGFLDLKIVTPSISLFIDICLFLILDHKCDRCVGARCVAKPSVI